MSGFTDFISDAVPVIGPLLGGIASLFKGKKTKYAAHQTPQQSAAYNQLLKMLQQRMGGQSAGMGATNDAMNMLYSKFLGRGYTPPQQQGGGMQQQGGIPSYASGGIAYQPQLAMVGERGPEAIIPLGQQGLMNQMQGGMQQAPPGLINQLRGAMGQPGGQQMGQQLGGLRQMMNPGTNQGIMNLISQMRKRMPNRPGAGAAYGQQSRAYGT
jgi:hypothetical protein